MSQHEREKLWNIEDVSNFLGVRKRTIYRYIKQGMPHLRYGGALRFLREEIIEWGKRNRQQAQSPEEN